ncbi:MAG TPA: hypothetical protein VGY54_13735 [Polyangiaceae bacterium]|nr:hypothetical protein [Polyangiaceae bacterium]
METCERVVCNAIFSGWVGAIAWGLALAASYGCYRRVVPGDAGSREALRTSDAGEVDATNVAQVNCTMVKRQIPVQDPSAEQLALWQKAFDEMKAQSWKPLPSVKTLPDGARVELESRRWSARFLRPSFDPWRTTASVERRAHEATADTPDALQSRFVVRDGVRADRPLRDYVVSVVETTYFLRVDVVQEGLDLRPPSSEGERSAAIADLAERVLPMRGTFEGGMGQPVPYGWSFQYESLNDGARFSTSPSTNVVWMKQWTDRVDGGIDGGRVFFTGYKKWVSGRIVVLDAAHWFDGKCWEPYVR